jgi:phosphoesterase RecJ-like protein
MRRLSLPRLAKFLLDAPRVLIALHEQPDADALGSGLALAAALRQLRKKVDLACSDPVPERYRFLPGWEALRTEARPAPLALVLDLNDPARLNRLEPVVRASAQVLILDHHPGGPEWPALAHVRPDAAAASLLVYRLLGPLQARLTPDIATCLYTGLGGDTGFFAFQNTSAEALTVAGKLVAAGADPYRLRQLSTATLPLSSLRLHGRALLSVRSECAGRLVYACLRLEDFTAAGAAQEETEGVVDLLKSAEGGQVFVLFKQAGPEDWRVSFRSDHLDVGQVARDLGGGGHAVAAGCSLLGPEEAVFARVLRPLRRLWKGACR